MNKRPGFTILELSIAIIILTILASLVVVSLGPLRESNRNNKRVADIQEMQTALAMFYRDWSNYPNLVTPGAALVSGSVTYLAKWPENPTPRNDGSCPDSEYNYVKTQSVGKVSYYIQFCLSSVVGDVGSGTSTAVPGQILTCVPNCVKSCGSGSNNCGGTCSNIAACSDGETCVADHCVPD